MITGVARDFNTGPDLFQVNSGDCDPLDASSSANVRLDVDADTRVIQSDVFHRDILDSARGFASNCYSGKWGRSGDAANGDITAWTVVGNAILIPTTLHCNKVITSGYVGIFYTNVRA